MFSSSFIFWQRLFFYVAFLLCRNWAIKTKKLLFKKILQKSILNTLHFIVVLNMKELPRHGSLNYPRTAGTGAKTDIPLILCFEFWWRLNFPFKRSSCAWPVGVNYWVARNIKDTQMGMEVSIIQERLGQVLKLTTLWFYVLSFGEGLASYASAYPGAE